MSLRKIVDQFLNLNVANPEAISSLNSQMEEYIQNIHAEIQRKSSKQLTVDELRVRTINELSHQLQMLENSNVRMFESLILKIQEIQENSNQSVILLLLASVSASQSPIVSARTKALDALPSVEIDSKTLRNLETENNCKSPLDKNNKQKQMGQTCRELSKVSYLNGLNNPVPQFHNASAKPGERAYLIENLQKFAANLTSNQQVAERFCCRTNLDDLLVIFTLHLPKIINSNHKEISAYVKENNSDYQIISSYKKPADLSKYQAEEGLLRVNTQDGQDLCVYQGADGAIYMRALIAYSELLLETSRGDRLARKDKQPLFYSDTLFRIDAEKETIVSSRIIPNDPITYPLLGIDKNQMLHRKPITAVITKEKLAAKNKEFEKSMGINPDEFLSAPKKNSEQEISQVKAKFEIENSIFHRLANRVGKKVPFFSPDVPKQVEKENSTRSKQSWMQTHEEKLSAGVNKTASDTIDSDDEALQTSFDKK